MPRVSHFVGTKWISDSQGHRVDNDREDSGSVEQDPLRIPRDVLKVWKREQGLRKYVFQARSSLTTDEQSKRLGAIAEGRRPTVYALHIATFLHSLELKWPGCSRARRAMRHSSPEPAALPVGMADRWKSSREGETPVLRRSKMLNLRDSRAQTGKRQASTPSELIAGEGEWLPG